MCFSPPTCLCFPKQTRCSTTPLQMSGPTPTSPRACTACHPLTHGNQSPASPQVWPRLLQAPTSWLQVRIKCHVPYAVSVTGTKCFMLGSRRQQRSVRYTWWRVRGDSRRLHPAAPGSTRPAAADPTPTAPPAAPLPAATVSAVPTATG